MKKVSFSLAALALLAATFFKGAEFYNNQLYLAKTDGYADAKAKYAPAAPKSSSIIALAICSGSFPAGSLALFDPSMEVTQDQLDTFTTNAQSQGRKCDESTYLGSVPNQDGSTDEIYRISFSGKSLWYVFTVSTAGLVTDIQ